jgi:hypothetical protein
MLIFKAQLQQILHQVVMAREEVTKEVMAILARMGGQVDLMMKMILKNRRRYLV